MDILNGRNVTKFEARRASFEDLIAKLAEAESAMRAGYKAESVDMIKVAMGMVNSLAHEHGEIMKPTRSAVMVAFNKGKARG